MIKTRWVTTVTDQHWVAAKIRIIGKSVKILKVYSSLLQETVDPNSAEEPAAQGLTLSAEKLRGFFKQNRIPSSNFNLALSCPGVITRIVTIPVMKKKLMDILFSEQVDQYFTLNVADYIIDYRVLSQVEEEGQKRYRVLLTAVPRDYWDKLLLLLKEAKLKPKAIDVQFECLTRVFSYAQSDDCVILNLSGHRAEIVILEQGKFFLFSEIYFDAQALLGLLEDKENPPGLPRADIPEPGYSSSVYPTPDEIGQTEAEATAASEGTALAESTYLEGLENIFFPVMRNLSDYLSFFTTRHFGKNVDMIYLTGEYAWIKDLDRVFQVNLEIPTFVGYPSGWKPKLSTQVSKLNMDVGLMGELIGLAMRRD